MMELLGLNAKMKKKLVKTVSSAAEKSSSWLWLKSGDRMWGNKEDDR